MPSLSHRKPSSDPATTPSQDGPNAAQSDEQDLLGNAFLTDEASQDVDAAGPFESDWLNGMLGAAFGTTLNGLTAGFGEDAANEEIGATASTTGQHMSFTSGISEDPADLDAMETVGHEVAHALAGTDANGSVVDKPGDQGEVQANRAGAAFRAWAASGFQGQAPSLSPAQGGQAATHRASSGAALTGSPLLRRGSTGELVRVLQDLLNDHGAGLAVDGDFGPLTESAVRNYQSSHGLDVDGIVGPQTAGSLNSSSGSSDSSSGSSGSTGFDGSPALQRGSKGSDVEALQRLLNDYGGGLSVDGDFGPKTESAVIGFQAANGLTVDGVAGPQTAGALNSGTAKDIGTGSSGGSGGGNFDPSEYDDMRDAVLAAAQTHLGAPYYWGADGPSMFDCSGFVLYVLREDTGLINWGDDTAQGISNRLPKTSNPKKGDCVFFSSSGKVQHIEICTGSGSGTIGAGGGGSSTFGDDPNAKVKWDDWNSDGRSKTWGSIEDLIEAKLAS